MTDIRTKPSSRSVPALAAASTLGALGTSIANVTLPQIALRFDVSMAAAQWVTLGYLLAITTTITVVGVLADRYGRGRFLLAGIVLFTAASILAAISPSLGVLVAARVLQGAGAAAMTALPVALVRQSVPPERIGRTMGILGSSMAAGMAIGPALGGVLIGTLGWQWAYWALVPLSLFTLWLAWFNVNREQPRTRQSAGIDIPGLILLGLALVSYSIALTIQAHSPWLLLGVAVASGCGFVVWELRSSAPLIDLRTLSRLGVLRGAASAALAAAVMMTFTVVPPFYLSRGLGIADLPMGLVLAIGPVVAIASGAPAGVLVDRFGARRVMLTGTGLLVFASIMLTLLPSWLGLAGFIIGAVFLTPGNQLFMAANNTAVMTGTSADQQGLVSGTLNLGRNLGFITATAIMAFTYTWAEKVEGGGPALGMQASFGLAAAIAVGAFALAWTTHHPQQN